MAAMEEVMGELTERIEAWVEGELEAIALPPPAKRCVLIDSAVDRLAPRIEAALRAAVVEAYAEGLKGGRFQLVDMHVLAGIEALEAGDEDS